MVNPGKLRRLAAFSSLKMGCGVTIVGMIGVALWAASQRMSDPGFPMVFSSPFFFTRGALLVLVLRGAVALYDRLRCTPKPNSRPLGSATSAALSSK